MFEDLLRFDKTKKYCFFDLETFNLCLNFAQNRPWQMGIIVVQGDKAIESHDILINWHKDCSLSIGAEAARITRYSHAKLLEKGIDPRAAWEILSPIFDSCDYICGHNIINFDMHLIKEYAKFMGRPWKHFIPKIIDTRSLIQGFKVGQPFNRERDNLVEYQFRMSNLYVKGVKTALTTVGKEYNIEHDYDNLHDAIVDLELNIKVWDKLKFQIEI